MSLAGVLWAPSPHDGQCHAMRTAELEAAADRGWADAICGLTFPEAGLVPEDAPTGGLCLTCAIQVGSELPDPGRFGAAS